MLKTRNIKGRRPRNKIRTFYSKSIMLFVVIFIIGTFGYYFLDKQVVPTLFSMAEMKIDNYATTLINDSIKRVIKENEVNVDELVTYYYNDKGEIISIGINTILINQLSTGVIDNINHNLEQLGVEKVYIPFGSLMGSNIFANMGPEIGVEILPIGTTNINYDREFRSTGINQINHRVWLNIEIKMQVIVPLATEQVTIDHQFTVVDNVISGVVPPNYIHVPEREILDVAPDIFK
ncbi:sporulation protein YunB [Natranaerovirga hydrolytica]|uniref:Sporulation protein YunB n=1 Tax=Natranaerovirga hydrolytica TaxID=680378 RepID=A0A4R1MMD1_9FIRM|nr:sporulation protein YunB [Natranaerovirga hydrolytica]TCK92434.1 sporulation protein YunB [Natranaerovirga hydrolytica]